MCLYTILTSATFWTAVTAFATIGLIYVAQVQLNKNNSISSANFLIDFKNSFFTEQQRVIVLLLEHNWLKFDSKHGYFINKSLPEFRDKFSQLDFLQRDYYLTHELDDFLMGNFEDAALLLKRKIIDEKDADQNFGYYLKLTCENPEIKRYINWAQNDDPEIYKNMIGLYEKLYSPKDL